MKEMTPFERAVATLNNEQVDELPAYPLACGVCRRLLPGNVTYKEWASDSNLCAQAFVEGFNTYKFPFTVTLEDLSVTAHDLGAHVRMDTENTPFVDGHIIHSMEDYEKIQCPDITKGRTGQLIGMNKIVAEKLKGKTFLIAFLEGPLLTLSQSAGAEQLFMDMFTEPGPIHKALDQTTRMCVDAVEAIGETGVDGMCWDYLWGNYSVLGDAEYGEFEGDKYAKQTNEATRKAGLGLGIHNCSDIPHLETQIKKFGVDVYSLAYYPLVPECPTATKVIEDGYADNCTIFGNLDPQLFMRATAEKTAEETKNLCQEVKTALCKRGLNSHFGIASGCEVPPDLETRMENVQAVMDATHQYGKMEY
ncbi:MAG: uroporphyrinogen decarboxylase family protein [Thermoplasmata archaeon]|nr:uroporphyrinogen decarboxylase family protein [Thermoplasmata archaeon]